MLENVTRRRLPLPDAGVEIALLDWGGEGPLALLHHANGFCAALWTEVADELRHHYRVVAMDARGHGDSSKPTGDDAYLWHRFGDDARAVATALAAEHPDGRIALALGHSFGGTSLMLAASQEPALFDRLVMVDPVMKPPRGALSPDPERENRAGELADRARRRRQVFESRQAASESWREKAMFATWTQRAFDLYLAEGLADRPDGSVQLKCPGEVEGAIFAAGPDFDFWEVASRVKTPALLLWAERGDFPRAVYESVARRMADAEVRAVAAGHLVPMERPDLVVDAVLDFAGRAADQRSTG
jgi:pimeloyl-ACP methyl ester carboxylesterase